MLLQWFSGLLKIDVIIIVIEPYEIGASLLSAKTMSNLCGEYLVEQLPKPAMDVELLTNIQFYSFIIVYFCQVLPYCVRAQDCYPYFSKNFFLDMSLDNVQ